MAVAREVNQLKIGSLLSSVQMGPGAEVFMPSTGKRETARVLPG